MGRVKFTPSQDCQSPKGLTKLGGKKRRRFTHQKQQYISRFQIPFCHRKRELEIRFPLLAKYLFATSTCTCCRNLLRNLHLLHKNHWLPSMEFRPRNYTTEREAHALPRVRAEHHPFSAPSSPLHQVQLTVTNSLKFFRYFSLTLSACLVAKKI